MKNNYQNSMESVVSTLDERNEMLVLDGKTVNVKLSEGEFVAWMVEGDPDMVPFKTEKECKEYRTREWGSLYKSEAEMDELIPVCQYIFTGKMGVEENVPVCSAMNRFRITVIKSVNDGEIDWCDYVDEYVTQELVQTIELSWGEVDLVYEHDSLLDANYLTFGTLTINNCPPIEELEPERVELAIIGYLSVCDNCDFVSFNYNTLDEDIRNCIATING